MALGKNKKDKLEDGGQSKALNPLQLKRNGGPNPQQLDSIIKTTDSMNFINKGSNNFEGKNDKFMELSRNAIAESYEMARRRINSTYQDLVDSRVYVGTQFLAVQIVLLNFDREWDVKKVEHTINVFAKAVYEKLGQGIGVAISEDLVFESIVYIDKILPACKMTPDFASLVNAITWKELFSELVRINKLTIADKDIIEDLVTSIDENVKKGYYIKLYEIIVSRVNMQSQDTILLFSYETLLKLNREYSREVANKRSGREQVENMTNSYAKTVRAIETAQKNKDRSKNVNVTLNDEGFTPSDDVDVIQPSSEYLENFTFEMGISKKKRKKILKDRDRETKKKTLGNFVDNISNEIDMKKEELNKGKKDDINLKNVASSLDTLNTNKKEFKNDNDETKLVDIVNKE